jgi:hypothetical protein
MKIHSIPTPTIQKIHEMGLSDLHEKEFKLFAMEYNYNDNSPSKNLEYYHNILQHQNEDYDPGINDMFLNNLDLTSIQPFMLCKCKIQMYAHRHK